MERVSMPNFTLNREDMSITNDQDMIPFRSRIREYAGKIGMNVTNETKLLTAASELLRNMLRYANGGVATIELVSNGTQTGIRLTFTDNGPGIGDLNAAFRHGYSTGNSLGLGLPGARKLVSEFDIQSQVGKGTTVTILKWKNG